MDITKIIEKLSAKPRVSGTRRNKEISEYISKKLRELGFETEVQTLDFTGWKLLEKPKLEISGKGVNCLPVVWSGSGEIKGKLKEASGIKTFEAYDFLRYSIGKNLGYIITRPDIVWLQPLNKPDKKPYLMVYPDTYKMIKDSLEDGEELEVRASVKSKFKPNLNIHNVLTRNNSCEKILVCAHYDSIMDSPGANDNASGIAVLLELAERFSGNSEIGFISFDAEEWNKFGSYAYVNSLGKNKLKKIKAVVNIDMVGAGKPFIIVSKELEKTIKKAINPEIKISTDVQQSSDEWPFYKNGVKIVRFVSSPYDYCHDPKDTIDKIDFELIKRVVKLAENIVRELV